MTVKDIIKTLKPYEMLSIYVIGKDGYRDCLLHKVTDEQVYETMNIIKEAIINGEIVELGVEADALCIYIEGEND